MDKQPETLTLPRPQRGHLKIDVQLSADVNITAVTARRKVNAFLATHIGNLLLADEPTLSLGDRLVWRVPVDLTAPSVGRIGRVGEIDVDIESGDLLVDESKLAKIEEHAHRLTTGSPL